MNSLDLLESCLKESGIKAVDGDSQGRKNTDNPNLKTIMEAEVEKEEEEEEEEEDGEEELDEDVGLIEGVQVKIEEMDAYDDVPRKEVEEVYVCDSLESVSNAPKKVNLLPTPKK